MAKKKTTTSDAAKIMRKRYIGAGKKRQASLERERESLSIAEQIYDLRQKAGLSQAQLAKLVGTTQSAISRLEDADYGGHTLTMLRKIAAAMNQTVSVRLVPQDTQYVSA